MKSPVVSRVGRNISEDVGFVHSRGDLFHSPQKVVGIKDRKPPVREAIVSRYPLVGPKGTPTPLELMGNTPTLALFSATTVF